MSHVRSSSYVSARRVFGAADLAEFQLYVLGQRKPKKINDDPTSEVIFADFLRSKAWSAIG